MLGRGWLVLGWLFIAGEVTGPPPGTARGLRVSPPATRSNKTNNRRSHQFFLEKK